MLFLSENKTITGIVQKQGMKTPTSFARQFVAGETIDEAIAEIKSFNERGIGCTTTYLGESVNDPVLCAEARDRNCGLLDKIHKSGASPWESHVSVKLTQLGLDISRDHCIEQMTTIMEKAKKFNIFIRIDMEFSGIVQTTLDIWEEFFANGYDNIGVVLQAYLYRTEKDIRYVSKKGGRIRLVKGAYYESESVAFQKKSDVDANYAKCLDLIMKEGTYPGIATHDEQMIEEAKAAAERYGRSKEDFEFQQSYGIRHNFHDLRLQEGYKLRTTIPYGPDWFPYYTRRLAERPANAIWVLKNMWLSSGLQK